MISKRISRNSSGNNGGFTLIELLLATGIFSVLFLSTFRFIVHGSGRIGMEISHLNASLERARLLYVLERDLPAAKNFSPKQLPNGVRWEFPETPAEEASSKVYIFNPASERLHRISLPPAAELPPDSQSNRTVLLEGIVEFFLAADREGENFSDSVAVTTRFRGEKNSVRSVIPLRQRF
ncbi:MAG: prepilin-type N-terminal cleavage/methylation domain-containing protein [Puniceicoccales bacterium]|nr:prepilin-type N-terminal cleavage/methylation domain-containing protein [Puniceicoccales bacterium]